MSALIADGLSRRFGGLVAVDGVSLTLETGRLHAVIGPNGAGKSTLVNLLSGELVPTSGRLKIGGADATGWPAWRIARLGVGRSFQRTNVMPGLSVAANLRLAALATLPARRWMRRAGRAPELDALAESARARVGLPPETHVCAAGTLAHGQVRLLEIAMALTADPRVLLLDEPLAGLGAEESASLAGLLRDLARTHAVLLVEHDMDVVFAVADAITVMVDGRVIAHGAPEAVRADPAVREAYLGAEAA